MTRGVSLWGFTLALALSGAACIDDGTPAEPTVDEPGFVILAATGDTEFFEIDVDLAVASCTTTVGCPPTLGGQTKASLLTGATCGLDTPWDGALAFSRTLTCYDAGDPANPATWTGPTPIADPATENTERAYSAVVASTDVSQYVNSTLFLEPLDGYAHCLYEAEALILPSPDDAAPRAIYHRENPARMTWRVVVEPGGAGVFDCHFAGGPPLSSVDVDYPASVTASRPTPSTKGTYPASYDFATISPLTLSGGEGAARIRYVLDADVPVTPRGIRAWAERDIVVKEGATILDVVIDSTCARVDSGGQLQSIGVLFRKAGDNSLYGAVEIESGTASPRFECERTDGACNVIPFTTGDGGADVCRDVIGLCHNGVLDVTTGETDVDCGGPCGACTAELDCTVDGDCLSGRCETGTCVASPSCDELFGRRPETPTGRYELDPDGVGGAAPFIAYCDMTPGDAGWTLAMRLSTNTQNFSYASGYWDTTALLDEAVPAPATSLVNATDAKYPAFNSVSGTTFRVDWLDPAVTWTETRPESVTPLALFSGGRVLLAGEETATLPGVCHGPLLDGVAHYDGALMRFGMGSQFYGFNGSQTPAATRARWGFGSTAASVTFWSPQVALGTSDASLLWTPLASCTGCDCYGDGGITYGPTAANLWIR